MKNNTNKKIALLMSLYGKLSKLDIYYICSQNDIFLRLSKADFEENLNVFYYWWNRTKSITKTNLKLLNLLWQCIISISQNDFEKQIGYKPSERVNLILYYIEELKKLKNDK